MKKKYYLFSLLLVGLSVVSCNKSNNNGGNNDKPGGDDDSNSTWVIESPDKSLQSTISLDSFGSLSYVVFKDDTQVVNTSSLGFDFEEENMYQLLSYVSKKENQIDLTYTNISGKTQIVEDKCNEVILTFKAGVYFMDLTFRMYDDGYAFKYKIYDENNTEVTLTVNKEKSQFAIPDSSITWVQPFTAITSGGENCFAYEESFKRKKSTSLSGLYVSMPMLYQVGKSDYYSLITESGLIGSGYYGSFLKENEEDDSTGILETVKSPAGVQTAEDGGDSVSLPFTSPWRVGITGTLDVVTTSQLVEKVYDDVEYYKPDDYDTLSEEEKEIYNYDWVEPGVVAWNWLSYTGTKSQNDFELQREYVDLAANMGWKYTILDGGWDSSYNKATMQEFMAYANEKGVKVLVWCNALAGFNNGNYTLLTSKLNQWQELGIAGIKIDFFDGQNATNPTHQGEDINTIKWYETIYQECAKRKMVVNCHGSNKPTGERRVYPNVINREGIRGNEFTSINSSITVNELFIREVVGPSDFTPVVTPRSKGLTSAHQMALAVLFETGAPSMAEKSEVYAKEVYNDFYKSIKATYDEVKFLSGEPDEYYMSAKRSGDEYFIACANAVTARNVDVDLSFIGEGEYTATIYTDRISGADDDYQNVTKGTEVVTSSTKKTIEVASNGGFVIHLTKN